MFMMGIDKADVRFRYSECTVMMELKCCKVVMLKGYNLPSTIISCNFNTAAMVIASDISPLQTLP